MWGRGDEEISEISHFFSYPTKISQKFFAPQQKTPEIFRTPPRPSNISYPTIALYGFQDFRKVKFQVIFRFSRHYFPTIPGYFFAAIEISCWRFSKMTRIIFIQTPNSHFFPEFTKPLYHGGGTSIALDPCPHLLILVNAPNWPYESIGEVVSSPRLKKLYRSSPPEYSKLTLNLGFSCDIFTMVEEIFSNPAISYAQNWLLN